MVSPDIDEMEEEALKSWQPDEPEPDDVIGVGWWESIKKAARKIDAETAEVVCWYGDATAPYVHLLEKFYGGHIDEYAHDTLLFYAREPVPDPLSAFGKFASQYEAWKPWVHFDDLPKAVRNALLEKHQDTLKEPAA